MTTFDARLAQLEGLLEAENAALSRMDMDAVTALTAEKNRLVNLLRDFQLNTSLQPDLTDKTIVKGLARAADENKILLERAMRVQRRLMAIVASAGKTPVTGYGRNGAATSPANVKPRAIMARA